MDSTTWKWTVPLLFQIRRFRRLGINRSAPRSRELFQRAWKDVGKVFIAAVTLDVIYELEVYRWVYPGEALIVATVLAVAISADLCVTLNINDSTARVDSRAPATSAEWRRCLALLIFVRHANDRSSHPFLVYRSPFQASSSRPRQSCTATGEFGLVVVGNHFDAGGLLDAPSTSSPAAAAS